MGWPAALLLTVLGVSWVSCVFVWLCLWAIRVRAIPETSRYPTVSIIKPLAGDEDELVENLESHLQLDYPSEYEMILGVRSIEDSVYPLAKAFAEKHASRVRLVLQEGEPGFNPKVNQLLTLTRYAKNEVIALTDASVRVPRHWLKEHAALLGQPSVGLSTNIFSGEGETTLGAAFDNMTLISFCGASMAAGEALGVTQIIGKSVVISKQTLAAIGGWEEVKDLLAEDQRLGFRLAQQSFQARVASTFVQTVQKKRTLAQFWDRHTRWAMLRFRVVPGFWLEPLLNPMPWALGAAIVEPTHLTLSLLAASSLVSMVFATACARLTRGQGMPLKYLVLAPMRDVMLFCAWVRGMTLKRINWRGNELRVGKRTQLSRG